MSDLNKWIGSGRVTRDTELRYTPGGTAVADVGLVSNEVWTKDGEKQQDTLWIDVTLWGKQAEVLSQYLTKGQMIMVEGKLKLESWETEEGKRSKIKVVADRINLVPRSGGAPQGNSDAAEEVEEEIPF